MWQRRPPLNLRSYRLLLSNLDADCASRLPCLCCIQQVNLGQYAVCTVAMLFMQIAGCPKTYAFLLTSKPRNFLRLVMTGGIVHSGRKRSTAFAFCHGWRRPLNGRAWWPRNASQTLVQGSPPILDLRSAQDKQLMGA